LGIERGHDGGKDTGSHKPNDDGVCDKFPHHDGEDGGGVGASGNLTGGPNSDEDARDPNDHDADGVGDDGELETFGAFRGEPVLEEVGEHSYAEGNEHVG